MVQVNLSLEKETKEEWEDYLDGTGEFATLSAMVRHAVNQKISDDSSHIEEDLAALRNDMEEVKSTLENIEESISWVEESQPMKDVQEFAFDLLDELEQLSDEHVSREVAASNVVMQGPGPQTVDALAEDLDVPEQRVERALKVLKEQFLIEEVAIDGEYHYFRA